MTHWQPGRTCAIVAALATTLLCSRVDAQGITARSVEQHERAVFGAWGAHDAAAIGALDALNGVGFGFRSKAPRRHATKEEQVGVAKSFFASMDYYRITIDELHTDTVGDLGLSWGFYTEEFQLKGRTPERVRARFSNVWKREGSQWRLLTYHRDAQPFDSSGRYIPVAIR